MPLFVIVLFLRLFHGTVDTVSNHKKPPYWPTDATTASDSEEAGGAERLRVETKVNVELHPENKLNHIGEPPQDKESSSKDGGSINQTNSNHLPEQRKGEERVLRFNITVCWTQDPTNSFVIRYNFYTKQCWMH